MKILICEDERDCAQALAVQCMDFLTRSGIEAEILTEYTAEKIIQHDPDILLLDIEMPGISGITAKDMLCQSDGKPLIIFVSSHTEMMPQAFGRNVISFIAKPARQFEIEESLETAIRLLPRDIGIDLEGGNTVSSADIAYIAVDGVYTDVYLVSGKRVSNQRKSLSAWEETLQETDFLRVSDRHLVNCAYIQEINEEGAILEHSLGVLHISRRRKAACKESYRNYCKRMAKLV